jgi:hypothetical protein
MGTKSKTMRNTFSSQRALLLAVAFGGLAAAGAARGDGVPPFINYQGVLKNAQGQSFSNQIVTVNFRIYDAKSGGMMIWGTRQLVSTDVNGLFDARLGDEGDNVPGLTNRVGSIADVFTASDPRWLEIEIEYNNSKAMSPRQRFLTYGYAYQAGNAASSRGDFTVGESLDVKSNAYFQRKMTIGDTGTDALVFRNSLTDTSSLTVSQKMTVAAATTVNGLLNVKGNAAFNNDVRFAQAVEFSGPVSATNGMGLRGNTQVFGACQILASNAGSASGTIATNGFLSLRMRTNESSGNTITFTLDGVTYLFKARWTTGMAEDIDYKSLTLFPVKAGSTYMATASDSTIHIDLYYWPLP